MFLRVHVDFNSVLDDDRGRVYINTNFDEELLNLLTSNAQLTLYDYESMEVDAVAEFDEEEQRWYAIPDWSSRRDLPPLA